MLALIAVKAAGVSPTLWIGAAAVFSIVTVLGLLALGILYSDQQRAFLPARLRTQAASDPLRNVSHGSSASTTQATKNACSAITCGTI